ncbi:Uncharacterized protein FWK35_00031141, partial [Aphis craccivora]
MFKKPVESCKLGIYKIMLCVWDINDIITKYVVSITDQSFITFCNNNMWTIVHFVQDNSVEVVPTYWPNDFEFDYYRVRVFSTNINSLLEAKEKCERAQFTSDISDYDQETLIVRKRKQISKPKKNKAKSTERNIRSIFMSQNQKEKSASTSTSTSASASTSTSHQNFETNDTGN